MAVAAQADGVILKSGGRAALVSASLIQAPPAFGDPVEGNVFQLHYNVTEWKPSHFPRDARSLCHIAHAKRTAQATLKKMEE